MRIAYVTAYDANERLNWSGLGYSILHSLRAQGLMSLRSAPCKTIFFRLVALSTCFIGAYRVGRTTLSVQHFLDTITPDR